MSYKNIIMYYTTGIAVIIGYDTGRVSNNRKDFSRNTLHGWHYKNKYIMILVLQAITINNVIIAYKVIIHAAIIYNSIGIAIYYKKKKQQLYYDIGIAIIRFCIGIRTINKKTTKYAAFKLTKTDYKLDCHEVHPNSSLLY